jgi:hypothetical protein
MAPEQARGEPIDHRADLFSLGSVLYALAAGEPPFRAATTAAVIHKVCEQPPTPLRSLRPDVPAWLETLIGRLLAKDPAQRIPSAGELAGLLERYLAHLEQPTLAPPELPGSASTAPRKGGSRIRLSILTALAALTLGTACWLLAGGQTQPGEEEHGKQREQQHLAIDFRAGATLPPHTFTGDDIDSLVKRDADGLRITLAADRQHLAPVGLELPVWVRGDFDLSLGYEFLAVGEPIPTYGVGVALRVLFGEPSSLTALMSRTRKPVLGEVFGTFKLIKGPDGKDKYHEALEPKATHPRGRMRLRRTGTLLHFLVAEGGADYRELRAMEIGTEDVRLLKVYCNTDWKPVLLDMRFTDIDIRADSLQKQAAAVEPPAPAPAKPEPGKSRTALIAALVLGLLLLLALAGVWAVQRCRRPTDSAEGPADGLSKKRARPEAVEPPIGFACAACGKHLKSKPELAGKKIKCPQCGQAVLVPQARI